MALMVAMHEVIWEMSAAYSKARKVGGMMSMNLETCLESDFLRVTAIGRFSLDEANRIFFRNA